MRLTLMEYEMDIEASEAEKYSFVISIAKGELKFPGICGWIERYLSRMGN